MYLGKGTQPNQAAATPLLIRVTLKLKETERARLEWDLKNKSDDLQMYKERLNNHTKQLKDLYTAQIEQVMSDNRASVSGQAVKSQSYKTFETVMLIVAAVSFSCVVVQTLCYRSPIQDLFMLGTIIFIVNKVVTEPPSIHRFAITMLLILMFFDFVWIYANGFMYDNKYIDGGDRKSCRNYTFWALCAQVVCKILFLGGMWVKSSTKFNRDDKVNRALLS